MRAKKAKALRRLARKICIDLKKPHDIDKEYKRMKAVYKSNKGEI